MQNRLLQILYHTKSAEICSHQFSNKQHYTLVIIVSHFNRLNSHYLTSITVVIVIDLLTFPIKAYR